MILKITSILKFFFQEWTPNIYAEMQNKLFL